MSILIKDMEMPKKYPVTVTIFPDGISVVKTISGRRFTATAVSVPPHGRLIDAGELYDKVDAILTQILGYRDGEDVRSQSFQSGAYYSIQKVKNALSNAPTIIPAEED